MTISYFGQSSSQALAVHRCRFVDYNPAAISAIAVPPLGIPSALSLNSTSKKASSSSQTKKFGTLAIGRANGNIELYEWSGAEYESQAPKAWVLSKILYGPNPSKVDSLVFALKNPYLHTGGTIPSLSELRLFSAGGGNELLEWDLATGTILRTLNSQGGAIWSIAVNPSNTLLAVGCEDGRVRLVSLEDNSLQHHRRFDRVKCRVLSIAWGPPDPPTPKAKPERKVSDEEEGTSESDDDDDDDNDKWKDTWLVTGGSDSALRKWDVSTGRVVDRMSTDKMRGERTLVWAVGVLADGTIISGDSLGMVKFWDSMTCTQLRSFEAHGADVLCLAIGPDGSSVFTSGVDQKVCLFANVTLSNPDKTAPKPLLPTSRWIQATSKRMHSHDVRALAVWPPYLPILPSSSRSTSSHLHPFYSGLSPILISGGLDASLVLAPCATASAVSSLRIVNPLATSALSSFEDAFHRRVTYPTGLSPSVSVAHAARLVVCAKDTEVSIWRIIGKARVRSDDPVVPDATSDVEMNAAVVPSEVEEEEPCTFEKVLEMDLDVTTNIRASAISPDGRWLAASDVYEVKLFELTFDDAEDGTLRTKRVKTIMSALLPHLPGGARAPEGASSMAFTPDSGRLVLGGALTASVLVVDLSGKDAEGRPAPVVLRVFDQHRRKGVVLGKGGRVMKKMPERAVNGKEGSESEGEDETEGGEKMDVDGDNKADNESEDDRDDGGESVHVVITHMAVSPDGQWLATTDDHRRTHIFNLDAVQHHTTLPTSPSPVTALAFSPTSASSPSALDQTPFLLLAHANATISVFDVEARLFPSWAAHLSRADALPERWTSLHDGVLGVAFEPPASADALARAKLLRRKKTMEREPLPTQTAVFREAEAEGLVDVAREAEGTRHALFWGATWLCRVTLDAPVGWGGLQKKRRRGGKDKDAHTHTHTKHLDPNSVLWKGAKEKDRSDAVSNFKLQTRYRTVLFMDFLDAGELVVVERPLMDVLRALPAAFFKPKFGT